MQLRQLIDQIYLKHLDLLKIISLCINLVEIKPIKCSFIINELRQNIFINAFMHEKKKHTLVMRKISQKIFFLSLFQIRYS